MVKNGAYEKVTRNMVENLKEDFVGFRTYIRKEFDDLRRVNAELYNHLSSRLPGWVTILITVGGSLITGLIIWGVSH